MQPSSQIFSQYQTFTKSRVKPEDYVKKYSAELGVDDARERVKSARSAIKSTEDTITATPDSVAGRTSDSLTTDAQRNRLVSNEVTPLLDVLNTQNRGYTEAQQDAETLTGDVDRRVGYALQADDTAGNDLLTLYQAAVSAEATEEDKRRYTEELALKKAQLAESQRANNMQFGGGGIGGGATGSTPKAVMAPKSNGSGFAFADSTGAPISAAQYATLTGKDIRDVLYTMGQSGDSYAAQVYNQLRTDPYFGKGDANYDNRVKSTYSPLFWGTGSAGGGSSSSGLKVTTPLQTSMVKVANPQTNAKVTVR